MSALLLLLLILLGGRAAVPPQPYKPPPSGALAPDDALLDSLLRAHPERFDSLLAKADDFEIQIIWTQIDRDATNHPHFTRRAWHVDPKRYFNPASLVKLPVAVAALEKLHRYEAQGVTTETPMATGVAYRCQTPVRNPRHREPDRVASVGNYIRRMLLVSDNDAYNRLYEFIGQEELHRRLTDWGMPAARITNRFSPGCDTLANRHTNPITFLPIGRRPVMQSPAFNTRPLPPPLGPTFRGRGQMINAKQVVAQPFDFTFANYLTLDQVSTILQAILFPGAPGSPHLELTDTDRKLLIQYLGSAPHESGFTPLRSGEFYDTYKKYLYYGRHPRATYPRDELRSYNIVGLSYGYVADCAYFASPQTGTEFMLAAVVYVNHDGIINDGRYEYRSVGWPFMQALGEVVLEYEQHRARAHAPDLHFLRR